MQRSQFLLLIAFAAGCQSAKQSSGTMPDGTVWEDDGGGGAPDAQGGGTTDAASALPTDRDAGQTQQPPNMMPPTTTTDAAVVAPVLETPPGFTQAPAFGADIRYTRKQGNVTLFLPEVRGAADYRVFALTPDVRPTMQTDGSERIDGATIACAGLLQHNQCDQSEALTNLGPNFRVPNCSTDGRAINVAKSVLRRVQLTGLSGKTKLVIEAVDALCPFPGAYGQRHAEIACSNDSAPTKTATYQGRPVQWRTCPERIPVFSEAEIRTSYGSLILNGQSPVPLVEGRSPWESISLPAPAKNPKVLARAIIEVDAADPKQLPSGFTANDFFESFEDAADAPKAVAGARILAQGAAVVNPMLLQTSKLSLYSFGADTPQMFLGQGTLRTVLPDSGQNIMSSITLYPRRAFALPAEADRYVHVTFEVPANATQRRYWWFHACGAANAGQTIVDGKLAPEAAIVPFPSFMNPLEGASISFKGWNCIQIVPRGGSYEVMAGGPYRHPTLGNGRSESDLRIVINPAVPNANGTTQPKNVVNVSPAQAGGQASEEGSWMRQWDDEKKLTNVMLDDKLFVEQRVTFDVYFNRGRMVVYADGVQKVCNDYPNRRLTMAEAAIGVGHVLYHSSVERVEFMREDWLRTGQSHYLHNMPFLDQRSFDNYGVREGAALPSDFREAQCYRSTQ